MKTKDLTLTDVYTSKTRGGYFMLIEPGWTRLRHSTDYRRSTGASLLVLAIHPEQREILRDGHGNEIQSTPDANGNFVEGPLIDWNRITQALRDELVDKDRFQPTYPGSISYLDPEAGYFQIMTPAQLCTLADRDAAAAASDAAYQAERDASDQARDDRLTRYHNALERAGLHSDDPGLPVYHGHRDFLEVTVDQLAHLLDNANKGKPTT